MLKKTQVYLLITLLTSSYGISFASQTTQKQQTAITVTQPATQGSTFEKTISPLLREISRKKTELELRKLDRELEKLDEESLKAQLNIGASGDGNQISIRAGVVPNVIQSGAMEPPFEANTKMPEAEIDENSDIRVLMIYGFNDNLYAKIVSGEQGGYVVKKGDILPNGNIVYNVTPNYIEVETKKNSKNKGKKRKIQRIFVSSNTQNADIQSAPQQETIQNSVVPRVIPKNFVNEPQKYSASEAAMAKMIMPVPPKR